MQLQVLEGEDGEGQFEGRQQNEQQEREVEEAEQELAEGTAAQPAVPTGIATSQPQHDDGLENPTTAPAPTLRTSIMVPISSSSAEITPLLMQRLFNVKGVQAQALLLGLIDAHGVVTRSSLYNYIQTPLEGPGMANLELVDD